MADQKISQLTPYTSSEIIAGDLFAVVDTTNAQTKNMTLEELGSSLINTTDLLSRSGGALTGDLFFPDNIKAGFGDGSDLEIYHDGTYSYVGPLKFDADGHIVDPVVIDAALDVDGAITGTSLDMNGNADFSGNITLSQTSNSTIKRDDNTGFLSIQGGTDELSTSLVMYGNAHATLPNWTILEADTMIFRTVDNTDFMRFLDGTGAVFNEGGADLDFRIGSDTNTHAFFLQGSNGAVSVGTSTALGQFVSERPAGAGWALAGKTVGIANEGGLFFDATNNGELVARNASGTVNVSLKSNGNSHLNGGNLGIGTSSSQTQLHVDAGTKNYTGTAPGLASYAVSIESGSTGTCGIGIGSHNNIPSIQGFGGGTSYNVALCPANGSVAIGHTSPSAKLDVNGTAKAKSYVETYVTLSGTTPTITCTDGNFFGLNTTGNTTFTFASAPASGTGYGFSLRLTAGGTHTLTWPASVKWPGGTAPDNPASGETNIYAFVTHDGGTTWYGMVGGEAFS